MTSFPFKWFDFSDAYCSNRIWLDRTQLTRSIDCGHSTVCGHPVDDEQLPDLSCHHFGFERRFVFCKRNYPRVLPDTRSHFTGKHIIFLLHRVSFTAACLHSSHFSALWAGSPPFTKSTVTVHRPIHDWELSTLGLFYCPWLKKKTTLYKQEDINHRLAMRNKTCH